MGTKTRKPRAAVLEPQDETELDTFIGLMSRDDQTIQDIEEELNREIAELKEAAAARIAPLKEHAGTLFKGVARYCEKHRDELTADDKKSVQLVAGTIAWRLNPPSVHLSGSEEEIIKKIKALGLGKKFVRTKEEVNRNALLEEPDLAEKIAGVKIEQYEEFSVKYDKIELGRTKKTKKGKKKAEKK